jgi:hypothetical protein
VDWDRFLKEEVTTPTGRKWLESAGDWANNKIEAFIGLKERVTVHGHAHSPSPAPCAGFPFLRE